MTEEPIDVEREERLAAISKRREPFTEGQFWKLCDAQMDLPVPLAVADLTKPFVYTRKYGVFYVSSGYHQMAMSLLLAFDHGSLNPIYAAEALGLSFPFKSADHWLRTTPGTAFRSSVGKKGVHAHRGSLTAIERRLLGDICYLD